MSEKPYTNRELDAHFREIKETLLRIEEQTKKTNGRVSALEVWRGFIVGAVAIITTIILPVLFIVLKNYV